MVVLAGLDFEVGFNISCGENIRPQKWPLRFLTVYCRHNTVGELSWFDDNCMSLVGILHPQRGLERTNHKAHSAAVFMSQELTVINAETVCGNRNGVVCSKRAFENKRLGFNVNAMKHGTIDSCRHHYSQQVQRGGKGTIRPNISSTWGGLLRRPLLGLPKGLVSIQLFVFASVNRQREKQLSQRAIKQLSSTVVLDWS